MNFMSVPDPLAKFNGVQGTVAEVHVLTSSQAQTVLSMIVEWPSQVRCLQRRKCSAAASRRHGVVSKPG